MLKLSATRNLAVTVEPLGGVQGEALIGSDVDLPPVEVLHVILPATPSVAQIRDTHKWRKNNQNRSVVIAIQVDQKVTLFGPTEDRQPAEVSASTAQRVLQAALYDTSTITARKNLVSFYDTLGSTELSGIKNKGLFASHHLKENLPKRADWSALKEQGIALATKRKRSLIEALGFSVASEERSTLILKGSGKENRVVAVLLEDAENFDSPGGRFPSSPVSWGLSVAADNNVPWLIVLKKDQIRLHPGKDGVGVGQKGQAETFLELNLAQMDDSDLALLPLIFSATSLEADGEVQKILDDSSKYAVILGARLRERVYESVVPNISIAVAKKLQSQGRSLDAEGLQLSYSLTLRILFRLLFQAYAEDRGLLPAGRNEGYDANSLKTIAKREMNTKPEDFGEAKSIWFDLVQVWDAIDEGNKRWQVPTYNGGLFGRDPSRHPEGALIAPLELADSVMGPALQALLVDKSNDGVLGPVDFRSLSVREFGTIYEGLLESSLSLAEVDLTVDSSDSWVPAQVGQRVLAKSGEPYFHSASGERKATGSYFTPKFVVDHLVAQAVDPSLDSHLQRIQQFIQDGDYPRAGREFFDYRVADIAMGSAHFLVAAVDRIEAKMRGFLADPANHIPAVVHELDALRAAATEALGGGEFGDTVAISEIEDPSLLRRQIARRCVYGLDINPMAVELARLALWIHTFVPGLPMSGLNHNLVCANSLTGISSTDEALNALIPGRDNQPTYFDREIDAALEQARSLLAEAAEASEATAKQVHRNEQLTEEALAISSQAKKFFDVAVAARSGLGVAQHLFGVSEILESADKPEVMRLVTELNPAHLPYLFPEVFLRENSGFDALLGNPPWDKVKIDEQRWWGLHIPGVRALPAAQKKRKISEFRLQRPELDAKYQSDVEAINKLRACLQHDGFPGVSSGGDLDLANLFAWKNWHLVRSGGFIGLVLPRSALSAASLKDWREAILETGSFNAIVFASNRAEWLFSGVDERQSVCFANISKSKSHVVKVAGPVHQKTQLAEMSQVMLEIPVAEFKTWSNTYTFPIVDDEKSLAIFRQFQKAPKLLSSVNGVPVRAYCELHATNDVDIFSTDLVTDTSLFPVWGGSSFNLWDPDFGGAWARTPRADIDDVMRARFVRASGNKKSPYFGWQESTSLRMYSCRVAYRWVTNRTNTRTTVACLIPPGLAVNSAPVFVFPDGSETLEAFLLGVMSSIPFDWQSRRVVEGNLTFELLGQLTCPWNGITSKRGRRVIEIAATLAAVDDRFKSWARANNADVASVVSLNQKDSLVFELDALVCLLFGLDESEVEHIYLTFHRGWDFKPRLNKVLEYYEQWKDVND